MSPFLLCVCLVVQVALAIKLYLMNPSRKLNIYLSLIPTVFIFTTIVEINLYYTTDVVKANQLYHAYLCFAFLPLIFSTLSYVEYIKNYSTTKFKWLFKILNISSITVNGFWTIIAIFYGPSAHLYLSEPGVWKMSRYSMGPLFLWNMVSIVFWLMSTMALLLYLLINAKNTKNKWWFRILFSLQLLTIASVIFLILSHFKNSIPEVALISSGPATFLIFLHVWVLSGFKIFDVNTKNIYTHVLAATNNWVIMINDNGNITYMNDIAAKNSGYNIKNIINENIDDILEVTYKEKILETAVRKTVATNFFEIIIKFKKTSKRFNLQASLKIITMPDKTESFVWVMIDTTTIEALTIQKQIIEATSAELNKAYNDTLFIMSITSHDLKTPLKTIAELTELIQHEIRLPMPNRSEEYLGYINSITNQSIMLTEQIIEYMRIGVIEKKRQWLNVSELLEHIKLRLITVITKSSAVIIYEGLEKIYCDLSQIKELLANFLDNSIKYQTNDAPIIKIGITESANMYHFSIMDNGIGVHQDFIPKLFSKYSREEKVNASGTGIGLFLCKHIVESNYGEITVKNNKPDNGITILFTIVKDDVI